MTETSPSFSFTDMSTSMEGIEDTMNHFLASANVDAVYSEPILQGDRMIIPAAEVLSLAGFGMGFGGSAETADPASGGGGGGGGRILTRPVAVVVVSPEGVEIKPVVDATKIALAALTAVGFMAATMLRMWRGKVE